MATLSFAPTPDSRRRISLAEIDATVSARLGPTRGLGNSQPACFNRQIAMYLASHIGHWSTTVIGRFYNGRDHSTVCYAIQRIESLRESDPDVDALITELQRCLTEKEESVANRGDYPVPHRKSRASQLDTAELAEMVAQRVCAYLEQRFHTPRIGTPPKRET
jgi:hypothetical protein